MKYKQALTLIHVLEKAGLPKTTVQATLDFAVTEGMKNTTLSFGSNGIRIDVRNLTEEQATKILVFLKQLEGDSLI